MGRLRTGAIFRSAVSPRLGPRKRPGFCSDFAAADRGGPSFYIFKLKKKRGSLERKSQLQRWLSISGPLSRPTAILCEMLQAMAGSLTPPTPVPTSPPMGRGQTRRPIGIESFASRRACTRLARTSSGVIWFGGDLPTVAIGRFRLVCAYAAHTDGRGCSPQ
jgi:hypothetical protein